ncbi:MAG TPA: 30S ribosomal protein S27ae [Candidatus Nanoarchaeia archaeon]|nr:30S ribosomal protein S27ae [Candidatus Nanoarchaeia archaeon]
MAKHKHKPGKSTNKYSKYKLEGSTLKRLGRICPKCGPGVFLGEHKERRHCGRCSYAELISKA